MEMTHSAKFSLTVLLLMFVPLTSQAQLDPLVSYQWGIYNHGVPQPIDLDPVKNYRIQAKKREDSKVFDLPAMAVGQKSKIVVAVLDTGIQKSHPDLKNQIVTKSSECKALAEFQKCLELKDRKACELEWMDIKNPLVDLDRNGYPLDCQGWSLLGGVNAAKIMGRPDFDDEQGHGSHVSGIISAEANNGVGVRGITDKALILPVQVLGKQPSEPVKPLSYSEDVTEVGKETFNKSLGDLVARGVIYAIRSGAQVINFSMGWPQARDSQFMRDVIAEAQAKGIIIVAAAGNDATGALLRPCAYPGVICVGAHGPDGALAHFSNFGGGVDLAAPGVNILSTYPESKRPVRYRDNVGYEYLSGTSQASPFVAGAVAELLYRGIPSHEVRARLLVGSRKSSPRMSLLEGTQKTGFIDLGVMQEMIPRAVMTGNLDLLASIQAEPQAVIVPTSKEKTEINWDRQTRKILWQFSLNNIWDDESDIKVVAQSATRFIRVNKVQEVAPMKRAWAAKESREFVAELEIEDGDIPENSRVSSELKMLVKATTRSKVWSHELEADLLVPLTDAIIGQDIEKIPLQGLPMGRSSFISIDENLDLKTTQKDYLVKIEKGSTWELTLLKQQNNAYVSQGTGKLRVALKGSDIENIREQYFIRMDWDRDGVSDYVVGLIEDLTADENAKVNPVTFYVFDQQMKPKANFSYEDLRAQMPFEIAWQRVGNKMMPTWVGPGRDPQKKKSLQDLWENPEDYEKREQRLYWLNEVGQLQSLQVYNGYRIVDIIEGAQQKKADGVVSLLLAKNLGTEAKPSYLYDFAVADVVNGKIHNFISLGHTIAETQYRNVLDTRVDKSLSLDTNNEVYSGNFWFSEGYERQQKLSLFSPANLEWSDADLKTQRYQFDSALWVRAAFQGQNRAGAFVLTNSEIEYHDLFTGKKVAHSMERYTFYPDMLMTNLYFPLVLGDQFDQKSRIPALFTTESSQLSRGVKMLAPIFARDGSVVELVSPAKLRFVSKAGCRPIDTPVFTGGQNGSALDYYCGSQIIRVHLKF